MKEGEAERAQDWMKEREAVRPQDRGKEGRPSQLGEAEPVRG